MTETIPQRSLSTGALRAAASMKLSHMPKRAVQHSNFLAGYEVLPPTLKPGQVSLARHIYSEEVKDHEQTYLECDLPFRSVYKWSNMTRPEDYDPSVVAKPMKPGQPSDGFGHHKVAHWRSTSHSQHDRAAVTGFGLTMRQNGPSYQALNPPTCVGGADSFSTYREDFGSFGSDPRDKMMKSATSMPVLKTVLTQGSPKATKHIPGYSGFLPTNTSNPLVARVEQGANLRSTDKTNLTHQFHVNLVDYAGHKPSNPNNDTGGVKIHTRSEFGRSFRSPNASLAATGAF